MKHCARHLLLLFGLLMLAGCGRLGQASTPPPLVFPTVGQSVAPGPPPLSLYISINIVGGSTQHSIIAVDAASGHLRWQFDNKTVIQSFPILANNVLYASANDQTIYALDAGSGTVHWTYKTEGITSVQAVENGVVYAGMDPANNARDAVSGIYALDAAAGTLLWKASITGSLSDVMDNIVYVSAVNGDLYALNSSKGYQISRFSNGYKEYVEQI
jgi:outer membrane protein assembly factor BamB